MNINIRFVQFSMQFIYIITFLFFLQYSLTNYLSVVQHLHSVNKCITVTVTQNIYLILKYEVRQ